MKIRKISKAIISTALVISLAFSMSVPIFAAETQSVSSKSSYEVRRITGDGVRLRKEGHLNGTVLETMFKDETINFYPQIFGTDTEFNYMQRHKTKTYGYVDHHYVR